MEHTIDDTWVDYYESNSTEIQMHALIVKNKKYLHYYVQYFSLEMNCVEIILKVGRKGTKVWTKTF